MFEDKTQNNIMQDMLDTVDSDISTQEGTLINHALTGAATELEQAYINLDLLDENGYMATADREHAILRGKERGILPYEATNAIWKAVFNVNIDISSRFSAGELTYICMEKMEDFTYKLKCEITGSVGNTKRTDLTPIEFISGFESGELTELLTPARDKEDTDTYKARYFSIVSAAQAFGGNRAQYKKIMHEIEGVGACKVYRVTKDIKRISIYFLNSQYGIPSETLVTDAQEIVDPIGKQGEGEGEASIYHVVDLYACDIETIDIAAKVTLDTGYVWADLLPQIQNMIDEYFLELAKTWENEDYLTIRILRINQAIASVEGVIDVQETALNGVEENKALDQNSIPVRGDIICLT